MERFLYLPLKGLLQSSTYPPNPADEDERDDDTAREEFCFRGLGRHAPQRPQPLFVALQVGIFHPSRQGSMHLILNIQPLGRLESPDLPVGRMDNSLRQCHLQVRSCSPCLPGLPPLSFSSIRRPRVRPSVRPSVHPTARSSSSSCDRWILRRARSPFVSVCPAGEGGEREGRQGGSFPPIKVEFFLLWVC